MKRTQAIELPQEEIAKQKEWMAEFAALEDRPRTYCVVTYGCQMNAHDSETLEGMLAEMGMTPASTREEADFVIFNTCCVRDNAQRRALGNVVWLKELKKTRPELMVGVCGCMMQQPGMGEQILKQYPEEIRQAQEWAKGYRADMALLEAHPLPKDGFVGMVIKEKWIADKEAAGKMLLEACRLSPHDMELGEYRGMKMTVDYDSYRQEVKLILRGEMSHTVTMGTDVYGNLTRIENALANMPQKLEKAEERIAELERQTEQARAELGKPFAKEKELEAKAARLAELNAALNIDEKRKEPMEKRPMKDVLKAYQERADAQSQEEKGGTNEWNR